MDILLYIGNACRTTKDGMMEKTSYHCEASHSPWQRIRHEWRNCIRNTRSASLEG